MALNDHGILQEDHQDSVRGGGIRLEEVESSGKLQFRKARVCGSCNLEKPVCLEKPRCRFRGIYTARFFLVAKWGIIFPDRQGVNELELGRGQ